MANRITGFVQRFLTLFILTAVLGVWSADILSVEFLSAEEPLADAPRMLDQTPDITSNIIQTPDITFYLSPSKLIRTQLSELLLNSPEWTDFFTGFVNRLDAAHLKRKPASRLMNQLGRTFPDNPRSMNGLLNLFFFNLQGIWGNFIITDSSFFEPADPFVTFLSDFEPNAVVGLTGALLDEAGYPEQEASPGDFPVFTSEGKGSLYLGAVSPLKEDNGKSLFFLTRSTDAQIRVQNEFPETGELKNALSDSDSIFFIISITGQGLTKTARWLEQRPPESKFKSLAPGIQKLGENIQNVWFVIQETSGQTNATLTVLCREKESPEDLRKLFDESRELVAQWSEGRTLTPREALMADLLHRMELIQEDERFYVIINLNAPETIEKIKQVFAEINR